MAEEETNNQEEEVVEEVVEEEVVEEKKEERPEANYKAELARKNAELEKLRVELDSHKAQPQKRDRDDLSTWSDHELHAVKNSNDPSAALFKSQADEILRDRWYDRRRAKERADETRAMADLRLRQQYPDSLDPTSPLSFRIEEVMRELDLAKTPSGRLAAARIVAGESKGKTTKNAEANRDSESSRIADVKGQMVDGDRSKATTGTNPKKKIEESIAKLNSRSLTDQTAGMSELLKAKGLTADKFFKRR